MTKDDEVYVKLQKHLNNQAIGFPATKTGVEIRVLKHIFTPEEANIATFLSYKFEPLETIFRRAKSHVKSSDQLKNTLDNIQKKGGIEIKIKDGEIAYCNAPLVVGMYEFQLNRLTPEFIKDFNEYTSDKSFGVEFLSTELPQMRTIPVSKSISPRHNVSTFDEVNALLQEADGPFVILECICRKKKAMEGEPCKVTDRKEVCLAIGNMAEMTIASDVGRQISKDEAISIIEQNQKEGLVLQPSNTKIAEFICSCCGCCCGMLTLHKNLPKPLNFWATNYHAVVNENECEGCGNCEDSCQVNAVTVSEKENYAVVNLDRCLGCGVCVSNCPNEAIYLKKKPIEIVPPQTKEELNDIIMKKKKGKLGKFLLTGKLFYDAVLTGQTHLLKK
ncbi:MAG: 4Fe-4S binding protein [Deltaproteobacteria bacterium]